MLKIFRFNLNSIVNMAVLLFPLLNILTAYLRTGDGLLFLYVIYSLLIFVCIAFTNILKRQNHIKRKSLLYFMFILLEAILAYIVSKRITFINEYMTLVLCLIYWLCFSEKSRLNNFNQYMKKHRIQMYGIELAYYFVLLLSVLNGSGINSGGWGTITLKGPYSINHLLAYELLLFTMINLIFWIEKSTLFSSVLVCLDFGLILLTGVRSVLLALIFVLVFAFMTQRPQKQLVISIFSIVVLIYMFYNTRLFSGLIEKTNTAIASGSITNGRGYIFLSSISAYATSVNPLNWIAGVGYDYLLAYNRQHILMSIHAHNDFIDALVQYGLIGFSLYIVGLKKVVSCLQTKTSKIVFFLIFISLAGFNGYYMYQTVVVMCSVMMLYAESVKVNKKTKLISS